MVRFRYQNDFGKGPKDKKPTKEGKRYIIPVVVVGLLLIWFVSSRGGVENYQGEGEGDTDTKLLRNENGSSDSTSTGEPVVPVEPPVDDNDNKNADTGTGGSGGSGCSAVCKDRRSTREAFFGGDLLDRSTLSNLFEAAKTRLLEQLHVQYGKENIEKLFPSQGPKQFSTIFIPPSEDETSYELLKRKLMIKILTMQTTILKEDASFDGCDCVNGDTGTYTGGRKLLEEQQQEQQQTRPSFAKYVWATGGHSSSAGHGNYFNESYTAYLGRDMREVFGAIGIEFEDRNYAMGGTSSAYEISSCSEQIFGSDMDMVTWDYGMTDGNYPVRLQHYFYRAGVTSGRPAFLAVHVGGRPMPHRIAAMKELEELGFAAFYGSSTAQVAMNKAVPDSFGLSDEQIKAMPEYIRNFKCGEQMEKGEPYCGVEKYSRGICEKRNFQAGWHPGFKSHAMDGHSLSLFLVPLLQDALKELAEHPTKDPNELLSELQKEEDEHFQSTYSKPLPDRVMRETVVSQAPALDEAFVDTFFKGPSLCRTGRLPAQARYLGYMVQSGKVGGPMPYGYEEFETGIEFNKARGIGSDGTMLLAYSAGKDRQICSLLLNADHKDFFLASQGDGWTSLNLPYEAEKVAYQYDPSKMKGIVGIFLATCDWGKCAAGDLREDGFPQAFELKVNEQPVQEIVSVGYSLYVLQGANGIYWKPDSEGNYKISVNIKQSGAYLKISSVVVF